MKKLSNILLVLLITTAATAQPRNIWKTIPNKTSTLVIKTGQPAESNFNTAIETLLDNGFEIERHDKQLGTISTAWKPLPRTGIYKLNIRATDNAITVRGLLQSGISIEVYGARSEDSPEDIRKVGSQKGVYGVAFNEMFTVAGKLGKVTWE